MNKKSELKNLNIETRLINDDEFGLANDLVKRSARKAWKNWIPESEILRISTITLSPEKLKERARKGHFYVMLIEGKIVGIGSILPHELFDGDYRIRNVFIDPLFSGMGLGQKLLNFLERDEFGLAAKRIEVSATLPAIPFYIKSGYVHKDNKCTFSGVDCILEKVLK